MLRHIEFGGCDGGRFNENYIIASITNSNIGVYFTIPWLLEIDLGTDLEGQRWPHHVKLWYCAACSKEFRYFSSVFQHSETSQSCEMDFEWVGPKMLVCALRTSGGTTESGI